MIAGKVGAGGEVGIVGPASVLAQRTSWYHGLVTRTVSSTTTARAAIALVDELQQHFRARLEALARRVEPHHGDLARIEWLRDAGRHGGGHRYVAVETGVFNRVALNVSHVHYDDLPDRRMRSATALSTIIHPRNPWAPSMHMHISWTQMREGEGYFRMMADLNPAIASEAERERFAAGLRSAAPTLYEHAAAQGERYFDIPALGRRRGITHFYLEAHASGDFAADLALAHTLGRTTIDTYVDIVAGALAEHPSAGASEQRVQLDYHTLYLLQVLLLDRGTTSGLLVHDQNDVGIMGSLPAFVDRALLASWRPRLPLLQQVLLDAILAALPEGEPCHVDEPARARLAVALREFYRDHPEALELQARGDVVPPTVDNHR